MLGVRAHSVDRRRHHRCGHAGAALGRDPEPGQHDRAQAAGCTVQRSHVFSVDTAGSKPRFCVDGEWRSTDFLVLAAGARNQRVAGSDLPT